MSVVFHTQLLNYDLHRQLRDMGLDAIEPIAHHPSLRAAYFHARRNGGAPLFIKAFAMRALTFAEQEARALSASHPAQLAPVAEVKVYGTPLIFVFPFCAELQGDLDAYGADAAARAAFAMAAALAYGSLSAAYARASLLYVDLDEASFRVAPSGQVILVDHDTVSDGTRLSELRGVYPGIPVKDEYLPSETWTMDAFFSPEAEIGEWWGLVQLGRILRRWLGWDEPDSDLRRALDDPAQLPPRARAALGRLLEGLADSRERKLTGREVVRRSLRVMRALYPLLARRDDGSAAHLVRLLGVLEACPGRTAVSLLP